MGEKQCFRVLSPLPIPLKDPLGISKKRILSRQSPNPFYCLHVNTLACLQGYFPRRHERARGRSVLSTHVIFEVRAGAAQQEDACALGVAILAGQVQSRVPRLGGKQTEGSTR